MGTCWVQVLGSNVASYTEDRNSNYLNRCSGFPVFTLDCASASHSRGNPVPLHPCKQTVAEYLPQHTWYCATTKRAALTSVHSAYSPNSNCPTNRCTFEYIGQMQPETTQTRPGALPVLNSTLSLVPIVFDDTQERLQMIK